MNKAKFYRKKCSSELSIVDSSGLIPAGVADQLSFRQVSNMSSSALRVYDEVVEFMASGPSAAQIVTFQLSEATKRRVAELIFREKTDGLTADEKSELDHFLQLEHLMRLTKARAHKYASS